MAKQIWKRGERVTDGGLSDKRWILPNGDVEELGSEFHYSYLLNNRKIVKKYKIDISSMRETPIRIEALKSGLFRVNQEKRSGQFVIEGCQKHFNRNVKDAIIELVSYTSGMINTIKINLYNDTVTSMKKTATSNVASFDKIERVEHIPFITESLPLRELYENAIL